MSGSMANSTGRCHHGPLAYGPRRIPPSCVSSGGADMVTGGPLNPSRQVPCHRSPVCVGGSCAARIALTPVVLALPRPLRPFSLALSPP